MTVASLLCAVPGVSRVVASIAHENMMHIIVRAIYSSPCLTTDHTLTCCSRPSSTANQQQQLPPCTSQSILELKSFTQGPSGIAIRCPWLLRSLQQASASNSSIGSICRDFSSTTRPCPDEDVAAVDLLRRRRRSRSATESRAVMRRTTESRAAIEDVAVMSRSQLMRRNKPWLAEQCWQHGLSHDGLKDDLIQHLLAWQGTDAGKAAAAAAQEAAAAAQAAMAAVAQGAAPAAIPSSAGVRQRNAAPVRTSAAAPPTAAAAAGAPNAPDSHVSAQVVRPAAAACAAVAVTEAESLCDDADDNGDATTAADEAASEGWGPSVAEQGAVSGWQPPLSASAAAAASVGLLLQQLSQQPDNVALVGAARNAVEQYASFLLSQVESGTHSVAVETQPDLLRQSSCLHQTVARLSEAISCHSSPKSLATLAKSCYSREILSPLLAASLAEAVAAVAAQLGPQEVYGVLRLLVVHLDTAQEDPMGRKHMDRGFRVLAEGMIRCSEALNPMQLAEAVDLLDMHRYDDAFGLWMLAKEAAARLAEFDPVKEGSSVVQLLNAIANMHVADDAMTSDVAQAVQAQKDLYAPEQLAAITAALQRMGYSAEV